MKQKITHEIFRKCFKCGNNDIKYNYFKREYICIPCGQKQGKILKDYV